MRAGVVCFDLDGTLTDSGPGIVRSAAYALAAVGAPPLDDAALRRIVGPPLLASFRDVVGLDEVSAQAALAAYREYFVAQGMFENAVYRGIPELLRALAADGRRLAITTSKPLRFAVPIAEHFGLAVLFETIRGPETDGAHETKAHVVRDALRRLGVEPSPRVVLVGDRSHDVEGAREVGVGSVGVLWGYGSRAELAGADAIVADVEELARLLEVTLLPAQPVEPAIPSVGDEALA